MANNLFTNLAGIFVGSSSFKIIDEITGNTYLSNIGIQSFSIKLNSTLLKENDEEGKPIIDGRIINPSEIEVNVICNSEDKLSEINYLLLNTTNLLTIVSRGLVFSHFMLLSDNVIQSSEMLSSVPIRLRFREILLQDGGSPICLDNGDSTSIRGGIKGTIKVASDKISELTSKVINESSKIFG